MTRIQGEGFTGLACPGCNGYTKVFDSRLVEERTQIRRRRRCENCKLRFSTVEVAFPPEYAGQKGNWNIMERMGREAMLAELKRLVLRLERPAGTEIKGN